MDKIDLHIEQSPNFPIEVQTYGTIYGGWRWSYYNVTAMFLILTLTRLKSKDERFKSNARHGWELNPWSLVYETNALPLGHHASSGELLCFISWAKGYQNLPTPTVLYSQIEKQMSSCENLKIPCWQCKTQNTHSFVIVEMPTETHKNTII